PVDPVPHALSRVRPLGHRRAPETYDIGRQSVAVAAAEAAAMKRPVVLSFHPAGRDALPVVVAKSAHQARLEAGEVERPQRAVERARKERILAADDVIHERDARLLGGLRILPCEIRAPRLDFRGALIDGPQVARNAVRLVDAGGAVTGGDDVR